jgi:anti-sigma regulatory factor (Ser/Thr protein kinase)
MTAKVPKKVKGQSPKAPVPGSWSYAKATELQWRATARREQPRDIVLENLAARVRAKRAALAYIQRWQHRTSTEGVGYGRGTFTPAIATAGRPHGAHIVVPAVPDAVRASRRLVRDICELLGLGDVADVAELLAGEVTSNVVLHTQTPWLRLVAEVGEGTLRVCVSDNDPQLPAVQAPSDREPTGRGLMLVDSLSEDWGAVPRNSGKIVWFTLSTGNRDRH